MDRFAFDLVGNRLTKAHDTGNANPTNFTADETISYSYDKNDRLLREKFDSLSGQDTTTCYEYDDGQLATSGSKLDGTAQTRQVTYNVLSDTPPAATPTKDQTFAYDLHGRLKTATTIAGSTTTVTQYEYDANGVRISQSDGTTKTVYVVDGQNPTGYTQVLEERVAGQVVKTYTLGLDVVTQAAAAAVYHLLYDAHGSTRALYNGGTANTVTGQFYTYDAYGKLVNLTGFVSALESAFTSLLYSGEWRDKATGWDFLRARWMRDGRFNSLDPYAGNAIRPQDFHKYLYSLGDSINFMDPAGKFALLAMMALSGTTVAAGALGVIALVAVYLARYCQLLTRRQKRCDEGLLDGICLFFREFVFC